ncbi:hypothetical protein D3C81_1110840 [compost metagenome]
MKYSGLEHRILLQTICFSIVYRAVPPLHALLRIATIGCYILTWRGLTIITQINIMRQRAYVAMEVRDLVPTINGVISPPWHSPGV